MDVNNKRILMISPTPTHPQDAGNRARIFRLAEQIRNIGYDLHFFYFGMEDMGIEKMKQYWGDRLFVFPCKTTTRNARIKYKELLHRLSAWRKLYRHPGQSLSKKDLDIDEWWNPDWDKAVKCIQENKKFPIVWVEYVFISKVLECFDSCVTKIIDTHDVFSNRHKNMAAHGIKPEWFSTTPEMEKRGLARADLVIAIHEQDADFFRSLDLPRVTSIGHFPQIHAAKRTSVQKRILFVGSHNPINLKAWEFFEKDILALIKERVPSCSIHVAGKICQRIPDNCNYEKLGAVEDLHKAYASSAVAINPMVWGTGLKIKTIEALAYGCPVVATQAGILGIEEAENRGVLVGSTPKEFAEHTLRLLTTPSLREEQSRLGQETIKDYVKKNRQRLRNVLVDKELFLRKEWEL